MFFFSSSNYQGYGKGQYSHALPAGVAFIGLLFLVVGVIIAVRFPGIVTDWTKTDVCIVKETDKRYKDWVSDLDRDITMSVQLRNLTNLESVIRFGEEPQFDWTIPINFTATSHKQNIKFLPDDHRVTFLKRLSYSPTDAELPSGLTVSVPNLWLLRHYWSLGDSASWLYHKLPKLMAATASDHIPQDRISNWSATSFWIYVSLLDCARLTGDFSADVCSRFSFLKWAKDQGYTVSAADLEGQQSWRQLLLAVLTDSFAPDDGVQRQSCVNDIEKQDRQQAGTEMELRCPACFFEQNLSSLVLMNHGLLEKYNHDHVIWSRMRLCYSKYRPAFAIANATATDREFYDIVAAINGYLFGHLRRELLLEQASRLGMFDSADLISAAAALPTPLEKMGWRVGVLPVVFGGDGDHLYDWNTCDVRWHINADINFQWRSLDHREIAWTPQSDYFVPPASKMDPCLNPRPVHRLVVMLEGIWRPAIFSYVRSDTIYSETVYTYRLTAGSLPYDDDILMEDLELNLAEMLGFPAFLTPFMDRNDTARMDDVVAMIQVEPITGAVWRTHLQFELSIVVPEEVANAANLTRLGGQHIPIARITKTSLVNGKAAEFLTLQLKPMLAVICGGVVVSTLLAMTFVGLALALVVKLHWKPFRERVQVQPEPQDLQLLNTIKLRKLLGN